MATRDSALDLVKGMLVIGMLIIHATFLSIPSGWLQELIYPRLLGFVSASWVVISGFIIGAYYQAGFASTRGEVTRRLLGRGLRLVAIFAIANVLLGKISLTCSMAAGLRDCDLVRVFLLGDVTGQAFEILLAIGYILILSPVFLRWSELSIIVTGALIVLFSVGPFVDGTPLPGPLRMLICGAAGIGAGRFVNPGHMSRLLSEPTVRRFAWITAASGVSAYLWFVEADPATRFLVAPYLVYVISALVVLYLASVWIDRRGLVGRELTVMAHYSLPSYMWQMAILHALSWLLPDSPLLRSLPVVFSVAFATLLLSLHALHHLRGRYALVDRAYRGVFG